MLLLICALLFQTGAPPTTEDLMLCLGHEELTVREEATSNLGEKMPDIAERIVRLHAETDDPEVRLRAVLILRKAPFHSLAFSLDDPVLRENLVQVFLEELEEHGREERCLFPAGSGEPGMEGFTLLHQSGSGHGQSLGFLRATAGKDGKIGLRRLSFQRPAYREGTEEEEVVTLETATLPLLQSKALVFLLGQALRTTPTCGLRENEPEEEGPTLRRHYWSSNDFTNRIKVRSTNGFQWNGAYTGYRCSDGEPLFLHLVPLGRILNQVYGLLTWEKATPGEPERALLLERMENHYEGEGWWVKERMIMMARPLGDERFLDLLNAISSSEPEKNDASGKRRIQYARKAIEAIRERQAGENR